MRSRLVVIPLLASFVAPLRSLAAPTGPIAATPQSRLTAQLRVNDERLLTAVHAGGRAVWTQLTTQDFIYVEEGAVLTRAELLAELEPDGYEPLKIRTFEVHQFGDFALVVHTDDVPEDRRNVRPTGHFLMTETWQRFAGVWKLHIVHVDAVRTDPPAVLLTGAQQDELAGTAELHDTPQWRQSPRVLGRGPGRGTEGGNARYSFPSRGDAAAPRFPSRQHWQGYWLLSSG
jgi:hypothetical protein